MAQEEVEISLVRASPCASIGIRTEADSVLKEAGGTWYYDYWVGITKNRLHKRLLSGPGAPRWKTALPSPEHHNAKGRLLCNCSPGREVRR
jgi:hypothetical protein